MKIFDLSTTISSKTFVYPTDPEVNVEQVCDLGDSPYAVKRLTLGTHSGTHVDVPRHAVAGGASCDKLPIGAFIGRMLVVDAPCRPGALLDFEDGVIESLGDDKIICFSTGWEKHAGTKAFFENFPGISPELAKKLIVAGVKAVATDLPSVDNPLSSPQTHMLLLDNGIVIIEALINLRALIGLRPTLYAVPLAIEDGDGSPVRAFATLD